MSLASALIRRVASRDYRLGVNEENARVAEQEENIVSLQFISDIVMLSAEALLRGMHVEDIHCNGGTSMAAQWLKVNRRSVEW